MEDNVSFVFVVAFFAFIGLWFVLNFMIKNFVSISHLTSITSTTVWGKYLHIFVSLKVFVFIHRSLIAAIINGAKKQNTSILNGEKWYHRDLSSNTAAIQEKIVFFPSFSVMQRVIVKNENMQCFKVGWSEFYASITMNVYVCVCVCSHAKIIQNCSFRYHKDTTFITWRQRV